MRKTVHRLRAKYNELVERSYRRRNPTNHYDTILVSYGGSGTTFILKFLAAIRHVNSWDSHNDGIKHANSPQHPVFADLTISKCVYIYSDPAQAAVSLFRRNFQSHMAAKLTAADYRNAAEYNEAVRRNRQDFTLEQMLSEGKDRFGLIDHWNNWTNLPVAFPTLFVRFEKLYDNLPAFFDFLELTDAQRSAFPPRRERLSSVSQFDPAIQRHLDAIYGNTVRDMNSRPALFERN